TATLFGGYEYNNGGGGLSVSHVDPPFGFVGGGTSVIINGTGFQNGATVHFGGIPATNVFFSDDMHLTCDTPAGTLGPVDVTVTNPDTTVATLAAGFHYTDGSTAVFDVDPDSGPTAGGSAITILGDGFQAGATVTIGGAPATNVVFVDVNHITCDTPPGPAGFVDVTVTNPDTTTATLFGGFNYTP
ncbi:MAG: IPT/TIG domain-containing protein, partial [Planctomycetota bacterium]